MKPPPVLIALVFLITTRIAWGDLAPTEAIVVEGRTYHRAKVSFTDAHNVVHLSSADGEISVPFSFLSPLMQQDADAKRKPNIVGKVLQRVEGGVLVTIIDTGQIVFLYHHPSEKNFADGDLVNCLARPGGVYHYKYTLGSATTVHAFEYRGPPSEHWRNGSFP